jgi:hypothetical protein
MALSKPPADAFPDGLLLNPVDRPVHDHVYEPALAREDGVSQIGLDGSKRGL